MLSEKSKKPRGSSITKKKEGILLVVALALRWERWILMTQRLDNSELRGRWEFPGGKVEPGESPEVALRREIREELGILCDFPLIPLTFGYHPYRSQPTLLLLYRATAFQPVYPRTSLPWAWVEIHALKQIPLPPLDLPFVDLLLKESP
jgi:8-oxo-dGTP diphosphatase